MSSARRCSGPAIFFAAASALLASSAASGWAAEASAAPPQASSASHGHAETEPEGFGWGAIPALNYNSDDGLGYGAVGNLYWYEPGLRPYKYSLTAQVYMTTRWVQAHMIRVDALDVGGLPLRLWGELGYYSTLNRNYCGVGNAVTCDPAVAERVADQRGLLGQQRSDFVRHYYQFRFIQPYGYLNARWALQGLPVKTELMAGWRGYGYIAGEPGDLRPYPGSLYQRAFPDGEDGFASVTQVGLMVDQRDNEPAPTRGYWIEASLRGAHPWIGSSWAFVGVNAIARGYVPLRSDRSVVLAGRAMVDVSAGDMPIEEIVRVGGSTDYTGIGGEYFGRGIRLDRYIGRVKASGQAELRWTLGGLELWQQLFELATLAYLDSGYVGYDLWDWRGDPLRLLWSAGGGLRLIWNKNFIVRLDVAASPSERQGPGVYLNLNHIF